MILLAGVFLFHGPALAVTPDASTADASVSASTTTVPKNPLVPNLSVDVPTITFSSIIEKDGALHINFLADYISGMYLYLLQIAVLIAVIMMMIGGLRYVLASGSGNVKGAKDQIRNAIVGLTLLMSVYMILFIVNPNLVGLTFPEITTIDEIELSSRTSGNEGSHGTMANADCQAMVDDAQANGTCKLAEKFVSPTGKTASCNYHFRDAAGKYKNLKDLDYPAVWDSAVYAPFSGLVTQKKRATPDNRCGNTVVITGTGTAAGASATFCHMKDFLNESGIVPTTITQGEVIGHLGGVCCKLTDAEKTGQVSDWRAVKEGWCKVDASKDPSKRCTDPYSSESCSCQPLEQSGNTSGPHVHVTWSPSGGDILACLKI